MSSSPHAIYLRFDDGFLPFAKACLNSLRANDPHHAQLIVDYDGVDPGMLALLDVMMARRLPKDPPPEFVRFLNRERAGHAVADRFKLFRSGFNEFDTIIHLDADMLVLKPLGDLLSKPEPYFVANHEAAPEVRIFDPRHARSRDLLDRLAEDRLPFPGQADDMANAGLFTLPRSVRTPRTIADLARLAKRYGRYFAFADQSLLSLWYLANGHRPSLTFADNFQTPFFTDPTINVPFDDIRVLHFSSARKPGTIAFDRWSRVGPERERLLKVFRHYRDLAL